MGSPSAIRNETGGTRICCRFRREHAHVEQAAKFAIVRVDHNCHSQRRLAYKRRSDLVCQRIGLIRDSKASRTSCSLTWKTLRRSRIFLRVDHWPEATTHPVFTRIKCNTANYVPIVVPGYRQALQAQLHLHLQHQNCRRASRINKK